MRDFLMNDAMLWAAVIYLLQWEQTERKFIEGLVIRVVGYNLVQKKRERGIIDEQVSYTLHIHPIHTPKTLVHNHQIKRKRKRTKNLL